MLKNFPHCSSLKPSKSKCEITGIGVLREIKVVFCGMTCVNLPEDTIKILAIHYSFNKQLGNDHIFKMWIVIIKNVIKLWRAGNLSIEEWITTFKSLAHSELAHLALVKTVLPSIIDQLNKTQKDFFCKRLHCKIKNLTINNSHGNGGLKNVNVDAKVSNLESYWIKRLINKNLQNWKILPLHLIH